MAKPDSQARHGKPGGTADQSTFAHGQAARGREDLDESAEGEAEDQAENSTDWGIEPKKSGTSKETFIGIALILVLLAAFGFVLYRKMQKPGEMLASIKDPTKASAAATTDDEAVEPLDTADAADADPFGSFAQQTSAPRQIEPAAHEDEWGFEPAPAPARQQADEFAEAAPPAGDNPFAQAKPAPAPAKAVPAKQPPPQDDFNPFGSEPEPQTAAKQPASGAPADEFEPFPETAAASTPPKTAAKAPAQISDPFGRPISATSTLPKKAAPPQQIAEDEFEDFPPASGTQAAASTTVQRPAKLANPPAGGLDSDPFPSDSAAGEEAFPDAFAEDDPAFAKPKAAAGVASAPPAARTAAKTAPATLEDPWGEGAFPSSEPFPATRGAGDPAPTVYEVRNGDNYWNISRKQYGTGRYYMALAEYNRQRIADPKLMRPGMKVMLPPVQVLESRYASLIPRGAEPNVSAASQNDPFAESSGFFRNEQGQPAYRIGNRDTLTEIARNHLGRSSRWIQIYEMNRQVLKSPNDLKVGTVLRLPADASRVEVVDGR